MSAQLALPGLPEIDPRIQAEAIRRLQKIVTRNRESFACQDYAKRRAAALKHTRSFHQQAGS